MTYTKEIWIPDESGMYILACNPNDNHGYVAVEIRGWGSLSKLWKEEAERVLRDRAIRIAALWNAAEELELTTEKIAEGEIQAISFRNQERSRLIGVALERIEKLEAEKAELLRALEAVTGDSEESDYMTQAQIQGLCRAAIKKARCEE